MNTTGALGKQVMSWAVWLIWTNIPWCSLWMARSCWMTQAPSWLSRTLTLVMVSAMVLSCHLCLQYHAAVCSEAWPGPVVVLGQVGIWVAAVNCWVPWGWSDQALKLSQHKRHLREGFDKVEMSVPKMKQMLASGVASHSVDFSFWIPLVHQPFTAFFFFCPFTSQKKNENLTWLRPSPRVWGDKDD